MWALNAHLWLHLLLAPFAVYWLARSFGLEREAAWVAGFCYALSGFFLSQLNLYNLIAGTALAPAFAAACMTASRGRRPALHAAAAGALLALVALGGDPIIAALAVLPRRSPPASLLGVVERSRVVRAPRSPSAAGRWSPRRRSSSCGASWPAPIAAAWGSSPASRLVGELGSAQRGRAVRAALLRPARSALLGRDGLAHDAAALLLALSRACSRIALVLAAGRPRERAEPLGVVDGPDRRVPRARRLEPDHVPALPAAASRPGCAIRSRRGSWSRSARRSSPGSGSSASSTVDRGGPSCSRSRGSATIVAAAWVALAIWLRPVVEALAARIAPALPAAVAVGAGPALARDARVLVGDSRARRCCWSPARAACRASPAAC